MLTLSWQYLLGRAVASEVTDRAAPEWPPHPDRVFQALVGAWGERGRDAQERDALEYIESLGAPAISAPEFVDGDQRDRLPPDADVVWSGANPTVYVPSNDDGVLPPPPKGEAPKRRSKKSAAPAASAALSIEAVRDWYQTAVPATRPRKARHFPSIIVGDRACALVWPDADPGRHFEALRRLCAEVVSLGHSSSLVRMSAAREPTQIRWVPCDETEVAEFQLRVPGRGRIAELVRCFADGGEQWRRPSLAGWQRYARAEARKVARGHHAGYMLVLRRVGGDPLTLSQTLALSRALRSKLLPSATGDALELLSGHRQSDSAPLSVPHVAYVPLAFVGAPYADGHLLGLALVLPRDASADAENSVLEAASRALNSETNAIELSLEDGRSYTFVVEERLAPPTALRADTWTAPFTRWATVTPIVLDRFPPRSCRDRDAFIEDQLRRACAQTGLPEPSHIEVLDVALLAGAPRAKDFPVHRGKSTAARPQVHAGLHFDTPVAGPLLLGAGRYRGYGLCKPLADHGTDTAAPQHAPRRRA